MTVPEQLLEPFDKLIGAWVTKATHPAVDAVVPGTSVFTWLEGRRFLLQRAQHAHPAFPDFLAVIGSPEAGDGLVMEYFDSRGVRRTYQVSLQDGVLRYWRDAPGSDQRFSGAIGHASVDGLWQVARTPDDWQDDVQIIYRRSEPGS